MLIYSDYFVCNHVGSVIVQSNANSSGELHKNVTGFTSNPASYCSRRYGKPTPILMPTQTQPPPPPPL